MLKEERSRRSREFLNNMVEDFQQKKRQEEEAKQGSSRRNIGNAQLSLKTRALQLPQRESMTAGYSRIAEDMEKNKVKAERIERCSEFDSFSGRFVIKPLLKSKAAPSTTKNSNVFAKIREYDAPPINQRREQTDSEARIQKKLQMKAGIYDSDASHTEKRGVVPPAADRNQSSSIKAFEGKFTLNKNLSQNQLFPLMHKLGAKHKKI